VQMNRCLSKLAKIALLSPEYGIPTYGKTRVRFFLRRRLQGAAAICENGARNDATR
jgi:hypothetical protein